MLFRIAVTAFLCLYVIGLFAQNDVSQFSLVGIDNSDFGTHIAESPSGDIIHTLSLPANPPLNSQIGTGLVRMDCAGKIKSNQIFTGTGGTSLISRKFILRGENPVLLSSFSTSLNQQKTHILELDENENILSQRSYLSSSTELPKDIIPWPNGGYLVLSCGNYNVDFENIQLFLVNSSFIINQSLRFSLNQRELEPEAMALTPDGGVIIIGDASTNTTFRQGFVMRLGAGGVPIWSKTFASDFDVEFSDMVFDENGVIHISGHLFRQNTGFDGLLLRVSGSGELIDARAFHATEDDKFRTLEKSGNEFIVAGDAGGFDDRSMIWMRLNTEFQPKDAHRLNYGSPFTNYVYASEPMNSGSWLLTGEFTAPNVQRDGGFIRTDAVSGGNCLAEDFQFSSESVSLEVNDVNVIRTEPERIVEQTDLEIIDIPVEENIVCSTVPPTARFGFVPSPNCPEVCVQFTDSSFCSINEWNWEFPGATPSSSNEQNPLVCYPGDGFYTATLIVSNEGGSDTLEVDVNLSTGCNLPVPNAFSPNGDGKNDFLVIPGFPPGGELFIYNRWGTEVFKAADYQSNWDGGNLSAGTYYYLIHSAEGQKYTGFISLIR